MDDLLVSAPGRNNLAVTIQLVSLFSKGLRRKRRLIRYVLVNGQERDDEFGAWLEASTRTKAPATAFAMSSRAPGAWSMLSFPLRAIRRSRPQNRGTKRGWSNNFDWEAAKGNRQGHRDATMILLAYRHGLRAPELVDLRWDQVDFNQAVLHVRRVKSGIPSMHPLTGVEMRALRRLLRESPESGRDHRTFGKTRLWLCLQARTPMPSFRTPWT
jgi:hypothetical protein